MFGNASLHIFQLRPTFFVKRFQLHALYSRKNGGVVRAPKEVLHKLQVLIKLLHGGTCGAEFVEQSKTLPNSGEVMSVAGCTHKKIEKIVL